MRNSQPTSQAKRVMPLPLKMVISVVAEAAVEETTVATEVVIAVIVAEEVTGTTTAVVAVATTADLSRTRTASSFNRAKSPSNVAAAEATTTIGEVATVRAATVARVEVAVAATVAVEEAAVDDPRHLMEALLPASINSHERSERKETRRTNKVKCE